jgi:hypothetical protein
MRRWIPVFMLALLGSVFLNMALADLRCSMWLENQSAQAAHFTVDGSYSCDAPPGHVCEFLPDCSQPRAAVAHCIVAMLSSGSHAVTVQAGGQTLSLQLPLTYYPAESDPDMGDEPAEYSKHCILQNSGGGVAVQCKD